MNHRIRAACAATAAIFALSAGSHALAANLPPASCMTPTKARALDKGLVPIFQKLSSMEEATAVKKTESVLAALGTLADGKYAKNQKTLCSISYIDAKLRAFKDDLSGDDDAALLSALSNAASSSQTSGSAAASGQGSGNSSQNWAASGTSPSNAEPKSCTGYLPSGEGIAVRPYTEFVAGGDSNTVWGYAQNGGRCTWGCKTGYAADASKSKCVKRGAGSGITVYVYDSSGTPLPGAAVEIIGSLWISTYTVANLTTDASGKTPENFDEGGTVGNILKITKTGYAISYASGCSSRVTKGNSYCDGVSMRDSVVKVYLSPTSGNTALPNCGSDWEKIGTFSCDSQNRQVQTIASCLPPLYDNPAYWNWSKNPDSFSHLTGKSCQ